MRRAIEQLSVRLGLDKLLIQGAGGNISWKDGPTMWIKASGSRMRDALSRDIFVPVVLSKALDIELPVVLDSRLVQTSLRPSIETTLHALMRHKIVVHAHSIRLLAKLVLVERESLLSQIVERVDCVLVCYKKPGLDLSRAVREALLAKPSANIVLLANHGVVVGGDTIEAVEATLKDILDSVPDRVRDVLPVRADSCEPPAGFRKPFNPALQMLAFDATAFEIAQLKWALTPDHVVFLGPDSCTYLTMADFVSDRSRHGCFAIIRDCGVFIADKPVPNPQAIEEMLQCFADIAIRIDAPDEIETLSNADVTALIGWEAEIYRRNLDPTGK